MRLALAFGLALAIMQSGCVFSSSGSPLIDGSKRERQLVIYSSTARDEVAPLMRAFSRRYPWIAVRYERLNTNELMSRYLREQAAHKPSADVTWSSAMDFQVKLSNDGYAMAYHSPEVQHLPEWAHWRDEAFATTYEPLAIAYNKKLLRAEDVPHTHRALLQLLHSHPDAYRRRVTTYLIDQTGAGYLAATQDAATFPGFWDLVRAMGASDVVLKIRTDEMLDNVATGRALIAYDALGSYARSRSRKDSTVGYVLPTDYCLVISRLLVISKTAPHPDAAKLWIDFVLSEQGQKILEQSNLGSVRQRTDSGDSWERGLGNALKPITVGPGLLAYLDRRKRANFVRQWYNALGR